MTSLGPNVDIVTALSLHVDSKYFSVAILTWVIHELIITTGDAVNLFWTQGWSVSKVFFFINGFAAVFTMTNTNALNIIAFDSKYACAVSTGCQFVGTFLILLTENFMLATRVYALWKGSYIILTIFFLVVSVNVCNVLFTYGIALLKGTVLLMQSPHTGCIVILRYNILWVAITNLVAVDTLSIGLILYKSWPIARLRGIKTPLFSLLLEDGLAHYIAFLVSKLFVVGCIFVPTVVSAVALPTNLPVPVAAITVNRLFLRLQRIMLNERAGLTDFTTARISTVGFGTSGDYDGSQGITTIGGSDKARRRIHAQRHSHLDDEVFSLGRGDIGMAPSKKDGELHPTASSRRRSAIPPTLAASG